VKIEKHRRILKCIQRISVNNPSKRTIMFYIKIALLFYCQRCIMCCCKNMIYSLKNSRGGEKIMKQCRHSALDKWIAV